MKKRTFNFSIESTYQKDRIKKELAIFAEKLETDGYAKATIRQYQNHAGLFLAWLEKEKLAIEEVEYKQMKSFINEQKETKTNHQINRILLAVRHYYNAKKLDKNPAVGLQIRGIRRSLQIDIIPYEELEELYKKEPFTDREKRNKIILGLLIYQAVTTAELHRLEPRNVKLKECQIYIPGSPKTNGRLLKLEAVQLIDLQEYIETIRPRMLENIQLERPGRKPKKIYPEIHYQLFFSESGSANIKNSMHHLFRAIKKHNPRIQTAKQIRASVICEWLKNQGVRQVQYQAGHKYVSSTERYQIYNPKELKIALKKHHPLK